MRGAWLTGLSSLTQSAFAQPSALEGWDLRELLGHVVLIHNGLARALAAPTDEPAVRHRST